MNFNCKQSWSLKTRMTLYTMVVFLISIWSLSLYASWMLQKDMEQLSGEQQLSTVSYIGTKLNDELITRLRVLEKIASEINPAMMGKTASLQALLDQHQILQILFNDGVFVTGSDGIVIAEIPQSAGRIGLNFMDRKNISVSIKEGKPMIGQPVMSKRLNAPIFSISVPVHDTKGKVIGVLAGVINLNLPSFLDVLTNNRYGKSGGYLLVDPQHRMVVTATDKRRIMTPSAAPGASQLTDRFIKGYEGTGVFVNSRGEEVLASAKQVPLAGWYVAASLPTAEAFAPIHSMQRRFLLVTIFLSLFAGGITWWVLRQMLSPLASAMDALAITATDEPQRLLPIASNDEIGQLINSFNNLLTILAQRNNDLQEANFKFRSLFDKSSMGVAYHEIIRDAAGKAIDYFFHDVNESYVKLTGVDPKGKTVTQAFPGIENDPFDWIETFAHVARTGETIHFEQHLQLNSRWYDCIAYQYKPDYFVVVIQEISERIQAEEKKQELEQQMHQAQRLESLGVLAGGIAHDFNNILAVISGYCTLINLDHEAAVSYISDIEKAAERAAVLCRQMMSYAGKSDLVMTRVNVTLLVNDMSYMLKTTINQNAVIKLDLAPEILFIMGDDSQLSQIVMNLIINAAEAIGEAQGEIRVSLARVQVKAKQADKDHLGELITPGCYACLEVSDTGCGMDDETRLRIFEPFYTTKFTGRGLGMSAVLGIITSHQGALQLSSQPGQGTTLKIYLPVLDSDPTEEESIQHPVPLAPWQGSGTILLVEDEDQTRFITSVILKKFGFSVIEAANGKEALELYQKHTADITVVMTDMGMPVMDGYKLFGELKKLDTTLPIIITSGFGDTFVTSRITSENIAGLVIKPYKIDQLKQILINVVGDSFRYSDTMSHPDSAQFL